MEVIAILLTMSLTFIFFMLVLKAIVGTIEFAYENAFLLFCFFCVLAIVLL